MGIKKSLEESKNPAFCMPLIFGKLLARSSVKKQFRNNRLASEFLGYVNPDGFVHHNSCCNCLPFWYNLSDYNFFDACRVPILQKIRKIQCATVNRYGWRRSHSLDSKNRDSFTQTAKRFSLWRRFFLSQRAYYCKYSFLRFADLSRLATLEISQSENGIYHTFYYNNLNRSLWQNIPQCPLVQRCSWRLLIWAILAHILIMGF